MAAFPHPHDAAMEEAWSLLTLLAQSEKRSKPLFDVETPTSDQRSRPPAQSPTRRGNAVCKGPTVP